MPSNFSFGKLKLRINKMHQRVNDKKLATKPKTKKSVRTISPPSFRTGEVKIYLQEHPEIGPSDRAFLISKCALHYEINRGHQEGLCQADTRARPVARSCLPLTEIGFSVLTITERLAVTKITFRYAHLFPITQDEMAERLDVERSGVT